MLSIFLLELIFYPGKSLSYQIKRCICVIFASFRFICIRMERANHFGRLRLFEDCQALYKERDKGIMLRFSYEQVGKRQA